MIMPDSYKERLLEEHNQLRLRIGKLGLFIIRDKYASLPEIDRTDLKEQLKHMKEYFDVLTRRVSRQLRVVK